MSRMARIVVPNYPHHVVQRGNRRQKTFFCEADYRFYINLVSESSQHTGTEVWAYCLMLWGANSYSWHKLGRFRGLAMRDIFVTIIQ